MSLDVISFLHNYFEKVDSVSSTYGEFRVSPCPNCGNSKRKLYVNIESKVFHCFVCGFGDGQRIHSLFRLVGANINDYIIDDGIDDGIYVPKSYKEEFKKKQEDNKNIEKVLPPYYTPIIGNNSIKTTMALSYLRNRGLHDNLISEYRMGFCYDGDYKDRIIVPYYEEDNLVYFVARDITGVQNPKYLNPKWEKKDILFNYERAKLNLDLVVIVEGVFDVLSLPDHSVCLLGKDMSDHQKQLLMRFKKIYVALDQDAKDRAYEICSELHLYNKDVPHRNIFIVDIPKGEDPGSLGSSAMINLLRTAKKFSLNSDTLCDRMQNSLSMAFKKK